MTTTPRRSPRRPVGRAPASRRNWRGRARSWRGATTRGRGTARAPQAPRKPATATGGCPPARKGTPVRGVVFNGELEVTDGIEVRNPNPDEVIVRISAAGVCHSDLSVVNGTIPFPTPVVLGHEGAGIVEEVGSNVSLVKPGDTVVLTTLGNCGRCPKCETGHPT